MNKVCLIGRTTKDIELKQTQNSKSVCQFTIAVNKDFGQDGADFINCIAWGKSAEFLSQYVKKGYLIGVTGRVSTRSYEQNGKNIYVTEIVCDSVTNLTPKKDNDAKKDVPKYAEQNILDAPVLEHNEVSIDTDDLPFY